MISRTVGMLYRYVAVLHRRFPLPRPRGPSCPSLLHHRDPSPARSHDGLSQSEAQRLRFTVAGRSFACSHGIRITRASGTSILSRAPTCVIDRAHTPRERIVHTRNRDGSENKPLVVYSLVLIYRVCISFSPCSVFSESRLRLSKIYYIA